MNQVIDASSDSYKGYSLDIYPRSSIGFKHQCYLANTVAIIDEDYYKSKNYGHIMIKLIKFGPGQSIINGTQPAMQPYGNIAFMDGEDNPFIMQYKYIRGTSIDFDTGDRFAQGIFHEVFAATNDDETKMNKRVGGLGSTGQ
jgi:dUTPase